MFLLYEPQYFNMRRRVAHSFISLLQFKITVKITRTCPSFHMSLIIMYYHIMQTSPSDTTIPPPCINLMIHQLGVVACPCNLATWKSRLVDGLRSGFIWDAVLCRSGVRAKLGINMVTLGEPGFTRLSKEGRIGPGPQGSRQKSSCPAVVGSRL